MDEQYADSLTKSEYEKLFEEIKLIIYITIAIRIFLYGLATILFLCYIKNDTLCTRRLVRIAVLINIVILAIEFIFYRPTKQSGYI